MSYGYLDRDKEKNETLINLISIKSSSYLVDDSLYELGNYFSSIGPQFIMGIGNIVGWGESFVSELKEYRI